MTFRLTNLFYLTALVATSLAAFGGVGVLAVVGVMGFWALIFAMLKMSRQEPVWIGLLFLIFCGLYLWPTLGVRETPHRRNCLLNLRILSFALLNNEWAHGHFPPAAGPVGNSSDLHSWRVLILPYLEEQLIYNQYSFDEPWNGPNNSTWSGPLRFEFHSCYLHEAPPYTSAHYFAITGSQTVWGDGEPRKLDDIPDGTANTILLMEAAGRGIHWAEPRDLTFDEAVELLTTPLPRDVSDGHRIEHGYFYKPSYVRHVAMCDGSCHALSVPIPREAAVALLTADGGEEIDPAWLDAQSRPQLDFRRVWVFGLWVVVALLPGIPGVRDKVWPTTDPSRRATPLRDP